MSTAVPAGRAPVPVTRSRIRVPGRGHAVLATLVEPVDADREPLPVVAFGHGFLQRPARYATLLRGLVSHGYLVVAPESAAGLPLWHASYAEDLWTCLEGVRRSHPRADPTRCAVVGHSMGGGASLLAAGRHPDIGAVATLAAIDVRPSALPGLATVRIPTLFVVGSCDRIVPHWRTRQLYAALPDGVATWVTIEGACHTGFEDAAYPPRLHYDVGTISRSEQIARTLQLVTEHLDRALRPGEPGGSAAAPGSLTRSVRTAP